MPDPVLSLHLRPQRLSQVLGQDSVIKALKHQMTQKDTRALMFHGGSGCGKTTLARLCALAVQVDGEWGELSEQDWAKYDSHTIHELNASDKGGIDDMRRLIEYSKYAPLPPSRKRVFIVDEVQGASSAAMKALLKPVEDASAHLLWVFCTTEPQKILDTLRRRCVSYELKPLNHSTTVELLKRGAKALGTDIQLRPLGEALEEADVCSPALILMALEKYAAGMEAKAAVVGADIGVDTLRLCRALTRGDWSGVKAELKTVNAPEVRWVRASVAGWLKSCLLRESSPQKCEAYGRCLVDVTGPAPLEDALLLPWMIGQLHRCTMRLK